MGATEGVRRGGGAAAVTARGVEGAEVLTFCGNCTGAGVAVGAGAGAGAGADADADASVSVSVCVGAGV